MALVLVLLGGVVTLAGASTYDVRLLTFHPAPILSWRGGSSTFQQVFNPTWVEHPRGLLLRAQNCTLTAGVCPGCFGPGAKASVLLFSALTSESDNATVPPTFSPVDASSIVFGPQGAADAFGTEDPRITRDAVTGVYYLFYSCHPGPGAGAEEQLQCVATTLDPSNSSGWTRHGTVGLPANARSGALLLRESGPHYLFWGNPIQVSSSHDPLRWPEPGPVLINGTAWGDRHCDPGPPPLRLSTGDYVFFFNSFPQWGWPHVPPPGYSVSWVILDGDDPTRIVAAARQPLWRADKAEWMEGTPPSLCNVPNVTFVEAAHALASASRPGVDAFRLYFGGADAVVGTALVEVLSSASRASLAFSPPRAVDAKKMPTDFMTFYPSPSTPVIVGREYNLLSENDGQTWTRSHNGSSNFSSVIHHFPSRPSPGHGITIVGGFTLAPNSTGIVTKGRRTVHVVADPTSSSGWRVDVSRLSAPQHFRGIPFEIKSFGLGGTASVRLSDGSYRMTAIVKRAEQGAADSSSSSSSISGLRAAPSADGCTETPYCPLSSCCAAHCRVGPGNRSSVILFSSSDGGTNWNYLSTIGDSRSIPTSDSKEGPNENDLLHLTSGSEDEDVLLAVLRFDGGDGCAGHDASEACNYQSYRAVRSLDGGRTWTNGFEELPAGCARPRLLQLGADALLMSGGRRRNANTSDVLLWVAALGNGSRGDADAASSLQWEEYSLSFHHNAGLQRGGGILPYDALVNKSKMPWLHPRETNAYTSLSPLRLGKDGTSDGATFLVFYDQHIGESVRTFNMEVTLHLHTTQQ